MNDFYHKNSDLEISRSVIVSATYSEDSYPNKIHVLKLEYLAKLFGIRSPIRESLYVLEGLREVQNIGNGFWVPAPTRAIFLGNSWMVCSPMSTSQLVSTGIRVLHNDGYARLTDTYPECLVVQSIEDWMGGRMHFFLEWISELSSIASDNLQASILDKDNLEFYAPWATKNKKFTFKRWVSFSEMERVPPQGVLLTRVVDSRISTYYWCSFKNGTLMESLTPVPNTTNEIIKLQFALEILYASKCRSINVIYDKNYFKFSCKFPLPNEIDRIFTAIGRKTDQDAQWIYIINNKHFDFVKDQVSSLNIKFE